VLVRPARLRLVLVLTLVALVFLIGVSRVYVGGHWASDVLGGWTAGLFLLFVLAEAYRLVGNPNSRRARKEKPPNEFRGFLFAA
jgi:undecaprenyl-diphosphatase